MTGEGLVTAPVGHHPGAGQAILQKHRIEKLPLVDEDGHLKGLITVKDIQKKTRLSQRGRRQPGPPAGAARRWGWGRTWKSGSS